MERHIRNTFRKSNVVAVFVLLFCLSNTSGRSSRNVNWKQRILLFKDTSTHSRTLRSSNANLNDKGGSTLKLVEDLQDVWLNSGGRTTFKCKVLSTPKRNITFTWYKDNQLFNVTKESPRITIKNRERESRLIITDAYSTDSAVYRCEASNIDKRVDSTAKLTVSFLPPPEDSETEIDENLLRGSCIEYTSEYACKQYSETTFFYKDSFQNLDQMKEEINKLFEAIANVDDISQDCQWYARKAFCYYLFPPCKLDARGELLDEARPLRLCREDCDLLKHSVCKSEFEQTSNEIFSQISKEANCSQLPRTTASSRQCSSVGLPRVISYEHKCYNGTGESYRGTLSITNDGTSCQEWPSKMVEEYTELSGGHNFCRNPDGKVDGPWCYTKNGRTAQCQVPLCSTSSTSTSDLLFIIIPAVSVPLLLGCLLLICCFACRKKKINKGEHTKGIQMETKNLSINKTNVLELNANMMLLNEELGDGKFGKVFKAKILSNLHYSPTEPVAVKTLQEQANSNQIHGFQLEMETFSSLQHENVACMKAVILQGNLRCMIFEYTSGADLHEYLVMHSPQADFAKPPSSVSSHTSSFIDLVDFIRMAIQIAAGMEYLTSNKFIHRDLAARNVLVCGNMEMKISNLGVIRDSYISSYYRSPQGGEMLPIRWMAPESINGGNFSDKSTIWSFGVLLWEMYSYGLQPYCGYSNHEVIEMISGRQLLSCPDQCPAKVYSLMQECWSSQILERPQFKEIHAKLVGWEGVSTTRMTSQLAQGIHRQLTNMKDQNPVSGQYMPYGPGQNRMTNESPYPYQNPYNGPPFPVPSPHLMAPDLMKRYNAHGEADIYSGQNYTHPPYPPHHISPLTMMNQPVIPSYSGPPSRSSGSVASGEIGHRHNQLRVNNLRSHKEIDEDSYPSPPPALNYYPNQSLDSGMSSRPNNERTDLKEKRQLPEMYVNLQHSQPEQSSLNNTENQIHHKASRPSSRMRSDGNMSLSVYQEQKFPVESETSSSPLPPNLAPKPPSYYNAVGNEHIQNNVNTTNVQNRRVNGIASTPRNPNPGGKETKAQSCDSGLPGDDMENEWSENHRLLPKSSGFGVYSQTSNPHNPISNSTISTEVTVESRVS